MPSAPMGGTSLAIPDWLFVDAHFCAPGPVTLSGYRRTADGEIYGEVTAPGGWSATFISDGGGGECDVVEAGTGFVVGFVALGEDTASRMPEIGTEMNSVGAGFLPSLVVPRPGPSGFVAPDGNVLAGDVTIETEPDGDSEGFFISCAGGADPELTISSAGRQYTGPCGRTAIRTINLTPPALHGEMAIQDATGTGTGVLRVGSSGSTITFTLETS